MMRFEACIEMVQARRLHWLMFTLMTAFLSYNSRFVKFTRIDEFILPNAKC